MIDNKCLVCETLTPEYDACPRCGRFVLPEARNQTDRKILQQLHLDKFTPLHRAILSHHIRKAFENIGADKNEELPINYSIEEFKNILKEYPSLPKAKEQLNNLIMYLGANIASPSESLKIKSKPLQAILGVLDSRGLNYVLNQAFQEKFVSNTKGENFDFCSIDDTQEYQLSLSFKGWKLYEKLRTKGSNSNKVFMAMAFSDEKEFMDKLYFSLKSAVSLTGFELHRIDEKPEAGSIPDRIKVEILNSKFVIADITHHNNGAYWEAGFAEGLGKKVIYTCKEGVKPHFDINHLTRVIWQENKIDELEKDIKAMIRSTFRGEAKMEDEKEQIVA